MIVFQLYLLGKTRPLIARGMRIGDDATTLDIEPMAGPVRESVELSEVEVIVVADMDIDGLRGALHRSIAAVVASPDMNAQRMPT